MDESGKQDPRPDGSGEPRLLALRIVWLALMAGVLVYAVVAWVLLAVMGLEIGSAQPVIARALGLAGGGGVVLLGVGLMVARKAEESAKPGADPEDVATRYFTLRIVGLALQESAGLLMITLSLLGGAATWAVASGLAAVAVMSISGPRAEHVERLGR